MRYTETRDDSAVSPVIGVILMVAITVILAAVIGTFVLGLGENVDGTTSAGVSVDQTAGQSFSVTIVDSGNLDTAGIVGPDGARSAFASTEDLLAAGATLRVADDANFARNPSTINATFPETSADLTSNPGNTTLVAASDSQDVSTVVEECYISHSADIVSGVYVDQAGIGCSGLALQDYAAAADGATGASSDPSVQALTAEFPNADAVSDDVNNGPVVDEAEAGQLSTGSAITYEAGAEYSFVGTVDGSENVVQSFTTAEE